MSNGADNVDLPNYENDEDEFVQQATDNKADTAKDVKKGYAAIHSSSFKEFLLRPELLQAVMDCGFEHPSEVQHETIPQAILGQDVICQAKSGMGKTAVFVLAVLQQLEVVKGEITCLVLCHTRELAYQICNEFNRFSKYMKDVVTTVFFGGVNIRQHHELLKKSTPNIVVGTPGRILQLVRENALNLSKLRFFVIDECDKVLESLDMRRDVQEIFKATKREKQVMMFSATMTKEIRDVAKKFMKDPIEISVDSDTKLTLHGLVQHFVKLPNADKTKKLVDLLDNLVFNQVVIFVSKVPRADALNKILADEGFPSIAIHSDLEQADRIQLYNKFKAGDSRILVATDIFGRGIDIERVNIVINYDMPNSTDSYLHRVGRAGRFGTKGLAISFVSSTEDEQVLADTQRRFEIKISDLPDQIDRSSYMTA